MAQVVEVQRRRRGIIDPAPLKHLFFNMLVDRLLLIEPLKRSIVTLVQSPMLVHRQMAVLSHLLKGLNRPLKPGCVNYIELVSLVAEVVASLACFP